MCTRRDAAMSLFQRWYIKKLCLPIDECGLTACVLRRSAPASLHGSASASTPVQRRLDTSGHGAQRRSLQGAYNSLHQANCKRLRAPLTAATTHGCSPFHQANARMPNPSLRASAHTVSCPGDDDCSAACGRVCASYHLSSLRSFAVTGEQWIHDTPPLPTAPPPILTPPSPPFAPFSSCQDVCTLPALRDWELGRCRDGGYGSYLPSLCFYGTQVRHAATRVLRVLCLIRDTYRLRDVRSVSSVGSGATMLPSNKTTHAQVPITASAKMGSPAASHL